MKNILLLPDYRISLLIMSSSSGITEYDVSLKQSSNVYDAVKDTAGWFSKRKAIKRHYCCPSSCPFQGPDLVLPASHIASTFTGFRVCPAQTHTSRAAQSLDDCQGSNLVAVLKLSRVTEPRNFAPNNEQIRATSAFRYEPRRMLKVI